MLIERADELCAAVKLHSVTMSLGISIRLSLKRFFTFLFFDFTNFSKFLVVSDQT